MKAQTAPPAPPPVAPEPIEAISDLKSAPAPVETTDDVVAKAFQYKVYRAQAIAKLLNDQSEISRKLSELGYATETEATAPKPIQKNPCRVCGAEDHDARRHRGETPAQRAKYKK